MKANTVCLITNNIKPYVVNGEKRHICCVVKKEVKCCSGQRKYLCCLRKGVGVFYYVGYTTKNITKGFDLLSSLTNETLSLIYEECPELKL